MVVVLDYVTQPAPFSFMRQHGVEGAVVYVAPSSWGYPKAVTLQKVQEAQAAGFLLAFNFEQNTDDYLAGYARGVSHGSAIDRALSELQLPHDHPCYLSIDTEVPKGNYQLAAEYFRGAQAATSHPLDFYGQNELGEYLVSLMRARRLWMSESSSFPGNGAPTTHTVLRQHFGLRVPNVPGSYDVNTTIQSDWGQFPRPAPTPEPPVTKYNPPINVLGGVAASLKLNGGVVLAGPLGHIYAIEGAPFKGGPIKANGDPEDYWKGRTLIDLQLPSPTEKAAGKVYVVIDSTLHRYAYPA